MVYYISDIFWLSGETSRKLEKEKGIVMRFVIGHRYFFSLLRNAKDINLSAEFKDMKGKLKTHTIAFIQIPKLQSKLRSQFHLNWQQHSFTLILHQVNLSKCKTTNVHHEHYWPLTRTVQSAGEPDIYENNSQNTHKPTSLAIYTCNLGLDVIMLRNRL